MSEKETEYEKVTVKVPKKLMQLIQDQNYFGRTPEQFFTDSVRYGVAVELNAMPCNKANRLERKYGIEAASVVEI
jgi:hypothetical protein